jgi:putative DNA primase/helicase
MNSSTQEVIKQDEYALLPSTSEVQKSVLNDQKAQRPDTFSFTDVGNAHRLVAKYGCDLRYCPPWRKWLVWDEKRWKVDETGGILRKAKATIRSFHFASINIRDSTDRKEALKHSMNSENDGRIGAMVRQAESEPGIAITPSKLDRHPYLMNCENGTLDLKTGKLREHRRGDLLTKLAPVKYDEHATCPLFDSFLAKITNNDLELMRYIQQIVGYSLTGEVTENVSAGERVHRVGRF